MKKATPTLAPIPKLPAVTRPAANPSPSLPKPPPLNQMSNRGPSPGFGPNGGYQRQSFDGPGTSFGSSNGFHNAQRNTSGFGSSGSGGGFQKTNFHDSKSGFSRANSGYQSGPSNRFPSSGGYQREPYRGPRPYNNYNGANNQSRGRYPNYSDNHMNRQSFTVKYEVERSDNYGQGSSNNYGHSQNYHSQSNNYR